MSAFFARSALLPERVAHNVRIEVQDGTVRAAVPDGDPQDAVRLPGVVLPGFANTHSHAFHRALRGRTHADGGSFWTWRKQMYAVAQRLHPDSYLALARAVYAEMALAGIVAVGEFHYLHHGLGGRPYAEPNVMAEALRAAARDAGIRLTLLDACYLAGGLDASGHLPLDPVQRRFADPDADAWGARVAALRPSPGFRIGVAAHSVRAVPRSSLAVVAGSAGDGPVHVHLSEQPAENDAALAFYGCTPTALLSGEGLLGPRTTVVHATHLTDQDVALLGGARVTACLCPTTERDLADGIGPARALTGAGARLSLGTDQHAQIDLFEEARGVEMHERLASGQRGRFAPAPLLSAMTAHASIGWPDAGRIAPGCRADFVAVRSDTVRTAGAEPAQLLFAASAADVDTVVVDGEIIVSGGTHRLGNVGALLAAAVAALDDE